MLKAQSGHPEREVRCVGCALRSSPPPTSWSAWTSCWRPGTGPADLGNVDDVLAETVYILLARQTRDAVYRRVFAALREAFPTWNDVLRADTPAVEAVLRPAGFQRQRAGQLQALLAAVDQANAVEGVGPHGDDPGDLTLEFLHDRDDHDAERLLTRLPGIGPKSARCVLAYSLGRPAFAVDTHVHRILRRLGLVESKGRKADHDPFQEAIPEQLRKRLHMNLVHHGRAVCRTNRERCGDCILVSFCHRGQQRLADGRPVAVDLFAGAGGLGLGFRQAGFRVGLAVEPDRHAAQTYRFNHPGTPVVEAEVTARTRAADIRRWLPKNAPRITALIAGTPCQGYSMAGHRRPESPSNQLYRHVARLARQLKPRFVVLENVPGVRSVRGHRFLEPIQNELERAGLVVKPHLLRASDYGVPQRRLRYFFLCGWDRRKAAPTMPPPTHRPFGQPATFDTNPCLPETPTVLECLADIPTLRAGEVAEYLFADGQEFTNMSTMAHSESVIAKISRIRPREGPLSYRRLHHAEATTIYAGHRAMPVHPEEDRTISVREAALIQGFPVDYFFCGPRANQPLQVANAVPPPVARAAAAHLLARP
jgi:DNA (cytosine-5)-methyltransferase 1